MRPDGGFDSNNRVGYLSYGRIRSIDYSKFFQNYWWLRSPSSYRSLSDDGTYWEEITNIAFYLYNGGDCSDGFYVGGRVARSYGRTISPFTGNSYSAWDVRPSGDVGNDYDFVTYSYGHLSDGLFQIYPNYWWLRSPFTNSSDYALQVYPSGYVGFYPNINVYYSYGILW